MLRRSRSSFFAIVLAACSSSGPDIVKMPPPPDVVGVDQDDILCDPIDDIADDSATAATPTSAPFIQWVNPFIGTGGIAWGTGSTYPGAQVPFGMARPSPDTSHLGAAVDFLHCSGYAHDDDVIDGFSQFHLHGAGIADYGGMALMPTVGMTEAKKAPRGHGSKFQHANEKASPGFYSVVLDDSNVKVDITATAHVGFHRFAFPASSDAVVIVDGAHLLADGEKIDDIVVTPDAQAQTVVGHSHVTGGYSARYGGMNLYFAAHFDAPFGTIDTWSGGVAIHFAQTTVEAHVGVSLVDEAHALANLGAEDTTFDDARKKAEAEWESRLSKAQISARSDTDRRIFYTALYHTAQMPALSSDTDGTYRGVDGKVHQATGRTFTDFSLWDTYRNLHSLIALVYPDDARELAESLVRMGKDSGILPKWPLGPGETGGMIGDGATIVLADTAMRGITIGWDMENGYAIARQQAMSGRDHVMEWTSLGYIPNTVNSSVAMSLEYAAADWALGNWAALLGQTADADLFHGRAQQWKKLYDANSHFLFPLDPTGTMVPVDPLAIGGPYTEGSAWHYDFMLPFDGAGLSAAMTRPVLLGRLEQFFTRSACTGRSPYIPNPFYWPANEPDLFSGWMFSVLGDSTRASRWLRWTTLTHYGADEKGLPGNDDSGTMSAFYIFASLGFYPIPGSDMFVLGSPLFPHATLGPVTIDAPGASKKVRFATPAGPAVVHHADLSKSPLTFTMK